MNKLKKSSLVTASLAAGLLVGGLSVQALAADDPDVKPVTSNAEVQKILDAAPVPAGPPEKGVDPTIGPWKKGAPAPDLVPIQLEDGTNGYLRTFDMATGSRNPDFVRKVSETSQETVLPVYAKDGQTVIGEFVSGTASWK